MFITTIEYGTPAHDEMVQLRYKVLREPLGLEFSVEELCNEHKDIHFALYDNRHNLLACMLLTKDVEDEQVAKMRQVAVLPQHQGKGYGSRLVETFEQYALAHGFREIKLDAREEALAFYEKLGYKKQGKPFTKVNIPHYAMKKRLKGAAGEAGTELWYEEDEKI
jgi:predicted GNAT family N-acyltransferase